MGCRHCLYQFLVYFLLQYLDVFIAIVNVFQLLRQKIAGFNEFLYCFDMEFLQQCVELVQSGVELLQAGWVEIDSVQAAADFLRDVFQLYVAGIQSVGEFSHFRVDFSDVADAVAGIA